jgi:2-amino-4-hydroxy-6-hydroxymethyldihydropteridine diphosphokinase/dihydropteroate synthase
MSPVVMVQPNHRIPLLRSQDPTRRTMIMAIFNATPDSFSGENLPKTGDAKIMFGTWFEKGADIIDFGGQSTRPGAELLSAEEELSRVLPFITQCKEMKRQDTVVSVDTFYSKVARECINAGADIVNDVSGGLLDEQMLPTVAELNKTIVLMHMRGNPETMTKLTDYPDGVVNGVRRELGERVRAALKAGIPPWRIILDPGIGFAKTEAQNLELLRNLAELRKPPSKPEEEDLSKYPWLIGPSRKGFIGKITGVEEAKWRQFGTAAAVTACVAGGAEIVRVHDVTQMAEAVRLADGIYRNRDSSFNEPAGQASISKSASSSKTNNQLA